MIQPTKQYCKTTTSKEGGCFCYISVGRTFKSQSMATIATTTLNIVAKGSAIGMNFLTIQTMSPMTTIVMSISIIVLC